MPESPKRLNALLAPIKRLQILMIMGVAILVGVFTGFASVAFLEMISLVQRIGFGTPEEFFLGTVAGLPAWRIVAVPALGGLIVGLIVHFGLPKRRPVSVSQVIEASALKGAHLSSRKGALAALASTISIGSGASVGREGPMVHLAGSIGAWIGKNLRFEREQRRVLLACGVASGIAASFNAPLAGTIFALEVILGHYAAVAFAPVVTSAVVGTLISRHFIGETPAFAFAELSISSTFEFPAFALLGILCGLAAVVVIKMITSGMRLRNQLPGPGWVHPAIAGALVGVIALVFPQVLGVGYEGITRNLAGEITLQIAFALLFAKLVATFISISGGFVGGIISPSLFMGSMIGTLFAAVALKFSPVEASEATVYVLVAMGAMVAAVISAPISTILFLFEITGNYELTLGVMLAVVFATVIVRVTGFRSFFLEALEIGGVKVAGGHDVGSVREQTIWSHVDKNVFPVSPEMKFDEVRERLLKARWGQVFVVEDGMFLGSITLQSWQSHLEDESPESLTAKELIASKDAVPSSSGLRHAMGIFGRSDEAHLPVIYSLDEPRLVGIVHEHDINLAYHRAVLKVRGIEEEMPR